MKKLKLKPPINPGALCHLDKAVVYNERTKTIAQGEYSLDGAIRASTILNASYGAKRSGINYRFALRVDVEIID